MMFFIIINNADDLNSKFDRYIRFFVGPFPEFATELSDNRVLCNIYQSGPKPCGSKTMRFKSFP